MGRKRGIPKINTVEITYNGNVKAFENFVESILRDYLNSFGMSGLEHHKFVGKVEKSIKTA